MKKAILPIILFFAVFVLVYLSLCFLIPGFRIKLAAEPMVYFVESLQHMALIKCAAAALSGILATVALLMTRRARR